MTINDFYNDNFWNILVGTINHCTGVAGNSVHEQFSITLGKQDS